MVVKGVSLNGSILVAVVEVIVEVVDKDVSLSGSSLIVIDTVEVATVEGRAVDELAATDDVDDVDKVVSFSGSLLMELATVDEYRRNVEAPVVKLYSVEVIDVSLSGS